MPKLGGARADPVCAGTSQQCPGRTFDTSPPTDTPKSASLGVHRPRHLPRHAASLEIQRSGLARCSARRYRLPKPAQLRIPGSAKCLHGPHSAHIGTLDSTHQCSQRRRAGTLPANPGRRRPRRRTRQPQVPRWSGTHLRARIWRAAALSGPVLPHRSTPVLGVEAHRPQATRQRTDGSSGGSRYACE